MLAVIGALSAVAGTALMRFAMIANQRTPKPAWTSSWLINGAMAPAVITLYAIGIILIVQFGLSFTAGPVAFTETIVALAILAGNVVVWRKLRPETTPPLAPSLNVVSGRKPSPAAKGGRSGKKAA